MTDLVTEFLSIVLPLAAGFTLAAGVLLALVLGLVFEAAILALGAALLGFVLAPAFFGFAVIGRRGRRGRRLCLARVATRRVVLVGGAVGARGGTAAAVAVAAAVATAAAAAAATATGSAGWSWCRGFSLEFSFGKSIKRRCLAADALCREESSRSEKVDSKPHSDDSFSNSYRSI